MINTNRNQTREIYKSNKIWKRLSHTRIYTHTIHTHLFPNNNNNQQQQQTNLNFPVFAICYQSVSVSVTVSVSPRIYLSM